jgi:hypothetical protein
MLQQRRKVWRFTAPQIVADRPGALMIAGLPELSVADDSYPLRRHAKHTVERRRDCRAQSPFYGDWCFALPGDEVNLAAVNEGPGLRTGLLRRSYEEMNSMGPVLVRGHPHQSKRSSSETVIVRLRKGISKISDLDSFNSNTLTRCFAICGLSLHTPSDRMVKSARLNVCDCTNSSTVRSTTGRSGSMRSHKRAARYLANA